MMADKPVISDERRVELQTRAERDKAGGDFKLPHPPGWRDRTSKQLAENNIYTTSHRKA